MAENSIPLSPSPDVAICVRDITKSFGFCDITKTGFNLTAWVTPFAALVAGGFGVRKVIRSWTRKDDDDEPGPGESGNDDGPGPGESGDDDGAPPGNPSAYSSRLQNELDNLET